MNKIFAAFCALLLSGPLLFGIDKNELVPLYPRNIKNVSPSDKSGPGSSWPMDPYYPIQHVDENAEYYLGSGGQGDTFFIVFEVPSPCSVVYAEFQWFESGAVDFFAAEVSEEALELYPLGQAPDRATSPVSPIGELMTDITERTFDGTMEWEIAEFESGGMYIGYPYTENNFFGLGIIKRALEPRFLADQMDSKGIRYTYTWFGGPWIASYPYWGAYSSNIQTGTVIEAMARVWVCFIPGMPILIYDVSQQSNTFGLTGPFDVTCVLIDDDPGITEEDSISLVYRVNDGEPVSVELEDVPPLNDEIYGASITGDFSPGDTITYWIFTIDEVGLVNSTENYPRNFCVLEPQNENADLLMVDDGAYNIESYTTVLDQLEVIYEFWDVEEHGGIDESVTDWGWGNIFVIGWGGSTVPVLDEPCVYDNFLDGGGKLLLIDQDYFFANGMPPAGTLEPGDFAYDYLGLAEYVNDPAIVDAAYYGPGGDPISGSFESSPYETYFDDSGVHLTPDMQCADYFTEGAAENSFWGDESGESYGAHYDNGYKTVFISFMAEAANEFYGDSVAVSEDFFTLINNVCDWYHITTPCAVEQKGSNPADFVIFPNYPNPFNAETTISFSLPSQSKIEVSIYNIEGKLVETLFSGMKAAGVHSYSWNAAENASGIYVCRVTVQSAGTLLHSDEVQKLLLLK